MKVLVDTCVWSLVLRRPAGSKDPAAKALRQLILENRALIMGPIRQELLSGMTDRVHFERLVLVLHGFSDLSLEGSDYIKAAQFSNTCRAKGVQGSGTDFLLCAASVRHEVSILTTDKDFQHYAKLLPIRLFNPGVM
ncbi:MAG: PIN domain-containing protein [Candidatus Hydrogenedentes bacterium]|nr:PIN domain-containing protein [Candidatus Hydrogenedentota bacterium]